MGISGGHTAQTSWLAVQETAISCEWRETKQAAPSRAPRSGFKVSWMVPWLTHSLSLQQECCCSPQVSPTSQQISEPMLNPRRHF